MHHGFKLLAMTTGSLITMTAKKIKLFILSGEEGAPKCIGTMKAEDGELLADLRVRLEEKKVLKFDYQYWDPDECCRVAVPLESLNDIEASVYMIPALDDEVPHVAFKRQRLGGEMMGKKKDIFRPITWTSRNSQTWRALSTMKSLPNHPLGLE